MYNTYSVDITRKKIHPSKSNSNLILSTIFFSEKYLTSIENVKISSTVSQLVNHITKQSRFYHNLLISAWGISLQQENISCAGGGSKKGSDEAASHKPETKRLCGSLGGLQKPKIADAPRTLGSVRRCSSLSQVQTVGIVKYLMH